MQRGILLFMVQKKIIVFDMDGVIFDSTAIAMEYFLYQYPGLTTEMHKEMLADNIFDSMEKIKHMRILETEEEKKKRQLEYSEKKKGAGLHPGMKEFLEEFHAKGVIFALNTSAVERNTLPLLEAAGILHYFDFLGTGEISKSKVEKFKIMEEKYGIAPSDMLFITDTLGDLREADKASVPTVAVTWGVHNREYFTREEHPNLLGIIETAEELKRYA